MKYKKFYYSDRNDLIFLFEFDFCDFSESLARAQIGCSQLLFLFLILQVYFLLWLMQSIRLLHDTLVRLPHFPAILLLLYTHRPPAAHFPRLQTIQTDFFFLLFHVQLNRISFHLFFLFFVFVCLFFYQHYYYIVGERENNGLHANEIKYYNNMYIAGCTA